MPARRTPVAAMLALVATLACAQPKRAAPPPVQATAGGYELATADGGRKCLLLLRPGLAGTGHAVGFPPPCRVALPVLAGVAGWTVEQAPAPPRLHIRLVAADGAAVIDFGEAAEDSVRGRDGAGGTYLLRPMAGQTLAQRAEALMAIPPPPMPPARVAMPAARPDPAAMRQASGTYSLQRAAGQETGCRLTLASPSGDEGAAVLVAGCADKGVQVFAPHRWSISAGTLWLVGAKGRLSFERNRRGGWDKGPGQGAPLTLAPARG